MFNKIMFAVIGISISMNGIYLLFEREFTSRKFGHIDFGSYHYIYGAVLLLIGIKIVSNTLKMGSDK